MNVTSINSSICSPVFKNIENNEIESEQAEKIKIAMLAAREDIKLLCENIQSYGINPDTEEGQKALIEIAETAAAEEGLSVSKNIQKFGVKSHEARTRIAKMIAFKYPRALCAHIENYEIDPNTDEGQKALEEIVKIALAYGNYSTVSKNIQKFKIKPGPTQIEIAKIAAANDKWQTSEYIKNYGIDPNTKEGQKALIQIAKIAAANDGWGTTDYIKEYEINPSTEKGQRSLIKIAKIAAANDAHASLILKNMELILVQKKDKKLL